MRQGDLPGMVAPGARTKRGPCCGGKSRLLYALIAVVAGKSDRSPASSVGCVRVTVEAVVADGQNSRVAPCSVKTRPSAAFTLGALVQV